MKILHLSSTTLSGSPIRIVNLLNKHTEHEARHLVWQAVFDYRTFETDLVGERMEKDEMRAWVDWADVIHYHNWYNEVEILKRLDMKPPDKPSVVQMHSPRRNQPFDQDDKSSAKLAVIAQYHVRQWPELDFIVPNVVDITEPEYQEEKSYKVSQPTVSYAPSNCTAKGWDNKGYQYVASVLKRMGVINRSIGYVPIVRQPHDVVMRMKAQADLGVDEFVTGSYHLSSLEYLALGVGCFGWLDEETEKVLRDLTGCEGELPWIQVDRFSFKRVLQGIINRKGWKEVGVKSRQWVEKYWHPEFLAKCYTDMYKAL